MCSACSVGRQLPALTFLQCIEWVKRYKAGRRFGWLDKMPCWWLALCSGPHRASLPCLASLPGLLPPSPSSHSPPTPSLVPPHQSINRSVPGEPGPSNPTEERFLAFGRVFSGVLRAGQAVHVLPPTYNPADPDSTQQAATLGALYLMMGRGLERLQVGWTRKTAVVLLSVLVLGQCAPFHCWAGHWRGCRWACGEGSRVHF